MKTTGFILTIVLVVIAPLSKDAAGQTPLLRVPSEIQSAFDIYCTACHGDEMSEGDVRLDSIASLSSDARLKILNQVEEQLFFETMPPENADQPNVAEFKLLAEWLHSELLLTGWKGIENFWSVENGTIVGKTTKENPTKGNTFLIWQGGDAGDFDFRCKVRFSGNNSGVQYRSQVVNLEKFVLHGNQADLHPRQDYFGILYGEGTRGITATRGQRVVVSADGTKSVVGKVGNDDKLVDDEWNELRIVAVGNRPIHRVNGVTTVDITDDHPKAELTGAIGLQLHAGGAMVVAFKDLRIKRLGTDQGRQLIDALDEKTKPEANKSIPNLQPPLKVLAADLNS